MTELTSYTILLTDIKQRIQTAQTRAMLAVNAELVRLYWQISQLLDGRQAAAGWGAGVIPRLARDIRNELPEVKGFSERNLKRMLAFYRAYATDAEFVPQAVAQTDGATPAAQVPPTLLMSIPWGHHILLLERVKNRKHRDWYMTQTLANGWSRSVLALQVDNHAHRRHGATINNFALSLPAPQSDLAQQAMKDPYIFDFLTLETGFHERELETGLVRHLEKFLLELGQGFAFVGRQYPLAVGSEDFYIDLLFYHLKLRSFVVVELKRGRFRPEHAGKLNVYCNVVDDRLRHETDNPTVGLMLCQNKDSVLAEYALRGIDNPIGIANYELTRSLPTALQSALPSIESIEAEMRGIGTESDG